MRRQLTPAQQAFAAGLVAGKSQTEAYREAYPSARQWAAATVWRKASLLAAHPGVRAAAAAGARLRAAQAVNTMAAHLRALDELSHAAELAGNFAAAVRAEECRGRAAGFYAARPQASRQRSHGQR